MTKTSLRRHVEAECNRIHRQQLDNRVRALRAVGLSWEAIAADLGCTGQTLRNWFTPGTTIDDIEWGEQ